LRIVGWLEGLSLIVLIGIAMPLKYMYDKPEAVKVVGMAHGVLFILYSVLLFAVAYQLKWTIIRTALGFIASFIPFGTFWAEFKLFRDDSSTISK
jgi:integral membrane protein